MKAIMYKGRDELLSVPLSKGWNRLGRPGTLFQNTGIRMLDDGTCMFFNCGGTLFFDRIVLQDTLSRVTFNLLGKKQAFGQDKECAPPRQTFIMRMKRPSGKAPSTFKYGDVTVPFPEAYRHPSSIPFPALHQGMYPVTGTLQADTPGGDHITPVQGAEQDAQWLIGQSDAIIHRTNLAWLDMETGEPKLTLTQPTYNGPRGWAKTTQIAEVCDLLNPSDPYNDNRKPKMANQGECSYFAMMAGLDRYNSYIPPDWQHFIRSLGPVIAAAACGDLAAQFMLRVFAADARYCHPSIIAVAQAGGGSGYYGTRECAWVTTAFLQVRETHALGKAALDHMEIAQMPTGCMAALPQGYPFSPSPNGQPDDFWQQSMELWLNTHPLALDGRVVPIKKALAGVFDSPWIDVKKYVPKFLRVKKGNVIDQSIQVFDGGADYFPWVALGAFACVAMRDPKWKEWMLKIATPSQGIAMSEQAVKDAYPHLANDPLAIQNKRLADLRTRLRHEAKDLGTGQVVAALSALELLAL